MEIILGPARKKALIHTANVLGYGNFLCQCVKARVDFDGGDFYSFDPAGRDIDQVENFSWGSGAGHDDVIAKRLFSSLTVCPRRILVMDDVMGMRRSMKLTVPLIMARFIIGLLARAPRRGFEQTGLGYKCILALSGSHILRGGEVRAGNVFPAGGVRNLGK